MYRRKSDFFTWKCTVSLYRALRVCGNEATGWHQKVKLGKHVCTHKQEESKIEIKSEREGKMDAGLVIGE